MRALKTQRASADGFAAERVATAKSGRDVVRWFACSVSVVAILMVVSTAQGQQESSRAQGIAPTSAPATSLGNALENRLRQFRSTGSQPANTFEPQLDRMEPQQVLDGSLPKASFDNVPNSPEIEEAPVVAAAVTEPFLDLTRETRTEQAASPSETSAPKSLEITAGSNPTHVLMRAVAWIVVALCIFSLTILGLRHWQRQRGLLPTTGSRSRVLETLSLGPGRTVSLIELAGFRALVASDAGGIRSLVLAPMSFHDELTEVAHATDPQVSTMTHQV